MTSTDFKQLHEGDVVRKNGEAHAFIMHGNYGPRVTVARTIDVSNPGEWLTRANPLAPGYLLWHKATNEEVVVTSVHEGYSTAAVTREITEANCGDWQVVTKAKYETA